MLFFMFFFCKLYSTLILIKEGFSTLQLTHVYCIVHFQSCLSSLMANNSIPIHRFNKNKNKTRAYTLAYVQDHARTLKVLEGLSWLSVNSKCTHTPPQIILLMNTPYLIFLFICSTKIKHVKLLFFINILFLG